MPDYNPIHSYPDATNVNGVSGGGRRSTDGTVLKSTLTKKMSEPQKTYSYINKTYKKVKRIETPKTRKAKRQSMENDINTKYGV